MKDQDAVSPVIGTLLVLVLFTVTTATIVGIVRPEIVEYQERGKVDTVAAQMGNVIADVRHLAINGNEAEIRQPVLSFHEGHFQLDKGHTVATTIGYFGNDSAASAGQYRNAGFYHQFHVMPDQTSGDPTLADVVDGTDSAVILGFHHPYHVGAQVYETNFEVARWNSVEWVPLNSGYRQMVDGDYLIGITLDPTGTWTIRDGPIRIEFYNATAMSSELNAQVYLYEQTSLSYTMDGERGIRYVFGENGGIMKGERGRYSLEQSPVIKPPSTSTGNELFSQRSIRLNATGAASASGSAQVGLVMRLNVTESFVFDNGATHVRMQFWGHHPRAMENQMIRNGFQDDHEDGRGVSWAYQKTTGKHWSFPMHFTDSQIDVRLQTR